MAAAKQRITVLDWVSADGAGGCGVGPATGGPRVVKPVGSSDLLHRCLPAPPTHTWPALCAPQGIANVTLEEVFVKFARGLGLEAGLH